MSEVLIKQSDVIEAIHSYWKEQINKLPVVECEYGEVITEDCWKLLKHNIEKRSCKQTKRNGIYVRRVSDGNIYQRVRTTKANW